jgi:molecular chaperone HtpG
MITDEKFYDKGKNFVLLKNVDGEFFTLDEYQEKISKLQKDKYERTVFLYSNAPAEHHSYITAAKKNGYDVLEFDNVIDNHFMQNLENKLEKVNFVRVDSDTVDNLVQKDETRESVLSDKEQDKVKDIFTQSIGDLKGGQIELKALSPDDQPVLITRPEFMRRMKEMQSMQGMGNMDLPDAHNVVINTNHPLVAQKLLKMKSKEKKEGFANYLHMLAQLNQNMLKGEDLAKFTQKSIEFLS